MSDFFSNNNIRAIIRTYKYHLIIIALLTAAISFFFTSSLFITPEYKSYAVVYPINLKTYSEESETEQMLQILQSKFIREQVVRSFSIAEQFGIVTTNAGNVSDIILYYNNHVNFERTPYQSVKITVYHHKPQIAKAMVDSIIQFYNQKVKHLHQQKVKEALVIQKRLLMQKESEIDSIQKQLNNFRQKYQILEYEIQTERLTEGYTRLLGNRKLQSAEVSDIRQRLHNLELYGGKFNILSHQLKLAIIRYSELNNKYEEYKQEYTKNIDYAQIVTEAYAADSITRPKRLILITISVFSSFVLSIIIFIIRTRY